MNAPSRARRLYFLWSQLGAVLLLGFFASVLVVPLLAGVIIEHAWPVLWLLAINTFAATGLAARTPALPYARPLLALYVLLAVPIVCLLADRAWDLHVHDRDAALDKYASNAEWSRLAQELDPWPIRVPSDVVDAVEEGCARGTPIPTPLFARIASNLDEPVPAARLSCAAARCGQATMRWALEHGGTVGGGASDGCSPLGAARDADTFAFLVAAHAPVTPTNATPPILDAITPEAIERLAQAGADLKASDADGNTALHRFLRFCRDDCQVDRIGALLGKGLSVNANNKRLQTPLELALRSYARRPVLAFLLAHGANPYARDAAGVSMSKMLRDEHLEDLLGAGDAGTP